MKRLIYLFLIAALTLSMAACGVGSSMGSNSSSGGQAPELVMPDPPTEGLSMMAYHPAYNTLQDITSNAAFHYTSFPSTTEITANSVTEFSQQEQANAFIKDFANLGYTGGYRYTVEEGYRNFFLVNTEYSKQLPLQPKKVVYNADTDTVYVMLGYWFSPYVDKQSRPQKAVEVANSSVASYSIIGVKTDKNDAEHIVFVSPKTEVCREDVNVSVVPYDAKYMEYQYFKWDDSTIGVSTHSYPSTKVPAANKVELITSAEQFKALQDEYNDIVNREEDWTIMEHGIIYHRHRANGLRLSVGDALINLLVSSPELDAYSSIRHEQPRIVTGVGNNGEEITTMCCAFYDEATQTVYIYLGYNGNPHTQYEDHLDKNAINEKAQATYVAMSVRLDEDLDVKNVVIVLPNPATVPSK